MVKKQNKRKKEIGFFVKRERLEWLLDNAWFWLMVVFMLVSFRYLLHTDYKNLTVFAMMIIIWYKYVHYQMKDVYRQ